MRIGRLFIGLDFAHIERPGKLKGACGCEFWWVGPLTVELWSPQCRCSRCGMRECSCPELALPDKHREIITLSDEDFDNFVKHLEEE